jgi:hypothetical protein
MVQLNMAHNLLARIWIDFVEDMEIALIGVRTRVSANT